MPGEVQTLIHLAWNLVIFYSLYLQLLSYHLKDFVEDIPIPTVFVTPRAWFLPTYYVYTSLWIYLLSGVVCLFSLPSILCMIQKGIRDKHRHTARPSAPISKALYGAMCMSSWTFFAVLYSNPFNRLKDYKKYLLQDPDGMPAIFMSFVTTGYTFLMVLGGIFFMEFFIIMWYISQKVLKTDAQNTIRHRSCLLCAKKLAEAMGLTGIVLFLQVLAGYSIYFCLLLMVSPLQAVAGLCLSTLTMIFATLVFALLIIPCTTACRRCPRGIFTLAQSVLMVLMAFIFYILLLITIPDNHTTSFDGSHIVSSLVSSFLLFLVAYTLKLFLLRKVSQEEEPTQYNSIEEIN